ncbi:hypothetical protein Poli38472_006036 [Pythium oligandrum]|uniref:VPS9 domain-containing protein n=1 Tax=Pythium oligandrum TaxID=41045 RepID=A0A8K1CTD0_PYTOL|nr:hypothetical protein Poli38472_006036 [Pythium oligandrum]|eukprot:TMW68568.1 hypothetical protein Poli38472_006036 [Pythium oligandrum]
MNPALMLGDEPARRKSAWRQDKPKKTHRDVTQSPLFGPVAAPRTGEKKRGILSGGLFSSKRKESNAAQPAPKQLPVPSPEALARGVDILQSIFPKWDRSALQMVLEANSFIMEVTITAILAMEEVEAESTIKREQANGFSLQHPVKNPLPDDFLRLPDDDGSEEMRSDDEREEDETGDERPSDLFGSCELPPPSDDLESKADTVDTESMAEDQSEKSSVLAEDDGTLYGKEFVDDGEELKDDVVTPVLNNETMLKNRKIVADSMSQKFIPAELRDERTSILDTSNIDVIKRSKLNINEAENRIRHREQHLVFELLAKASAIYRSGIISSQELDTLRSIIVSKIQPSKMLADVTMNMNKMISDHEWHSLILKAKGIRQALSVRIVNHVHKSSRSGHMEYLIRVVDVESGVVWFAKKRFKELHKLHRKLCRLSGRVNDCIFPTRRNHGRNSARELASDRAPVLEAFLRTTATLVTPPPMTFLNGVALKQLQQFLDLPHEEILLRNKTQPIARELRVYVYHTVNDPTSPEGKACNKFLAKLRQHGSDVGTNLLEEAGTILDDVQEYMLEHRFDEIKDHVDRVMTYYLSADLAEETLGRRNSYVNNLLDDDVLSSSEKLQQLVSDAIRHELEEKICVPLMADLTAYLRVKVMQKERQFRQRIFQLRGKPQTYFGIPVNKISFSSWRTVIESIKEIDDAFLPLDKMRKLVATAHQIHSVHRAERRMVQVEKTRASSATRSSLIEDVKASEEAVASLDEDELNSEDDVLSGDDFLPIFIYVIVHSDLSAPIMTQVLLNRLCDPEKRRSESGYYLATFEAALHHILSDESFDA